jgi:hypoxanthine-DNA glycosylase
MTNTESAFPHAPMLAGLAPVVAPGIRILVLGSFPGNASLAARQYYAHSRNQFWGLLSSVLSEDLTAISYELRLRRLLAHCIGLWDAIDACERRGSLDSSIRNARPNDFSFLRQNCPLLKRVCFNGKASGRFAQRFADAGYETLVLPSSSPAHARLSFDQKLAAWRKIIC